MSPPSQNGWNIACHASAQDNCDVMKWLPDHMSNYRADVNLPNIVHEQKYTDILPHQYNIQKGSTPLLIVCAYQNTEMFKFLLDQSDEVTQKTEVSI